MKRLLLATITATTLTLSAHAENWQTVGETQQGTIIEIDMDTIQLMKSGQKRVVVSAGAGNQMMYFDCNGHWGMLGMPLQHIPRGSIAQSTESLVCDK